MGVASDYRALAKRYRSLPEEIVRAGAAEMSKAILTNLRQDVGADQLMSGFAKRRRTKMNVAVKVSPGRSFATATVVAGPSRARSGWAILETGTGERFVGDLKFKTSGPGGKHMKLGTRWLTGPWSAGSSPAKHTFTEGVSEGIPATERAMARMWEQTNAV
jgi:hypothetical protein